MRIETERIVLRKAKESDLEAIWHNVWEDESISQWMFWKPTKDREEAVDRLKRTIAFQAKNQVYFVCLRETDEAIGLAGIREKECGVYEEAGICVAAKYQNQGLGTEILKALLELAFQKNGGEKFIYACTRANERSKKVCQKFGFHYDHSEELTREWDQKTDITDFYYLLKKEYK